MNEDIKVLVIDDHPSFVEGVSLILQSIIPDATILTALNGSAARNLLKQQPDIDWILLDINLPDCSGLELITHFRKIKLIANIVIITGADDPDIINQALTLHVNGFLTKDFDSKTLSECINAIEHDRVFLTNKHASELKNYRESLLKEKQSIEQIISQRQRQTLVMIAKGYSNAEIAKSLDISESTVKTHVSSLISLFEADNRTHCVAEARRLKVVA